MTIMNSAPAFPADYHLHTPLCKHAGGEPAAYLESAARKGIPAIAFVDHAPAPGGYDARHRMSMEEFPRYAGCVSALKEGADRPVLFGVEADYYDGCESFLRDWLRAQSFDVVLGSIHYIGDWGFDCETALAQWPKADVKAVWKQYFRLMIKLADSRMYDVVAHPDLPKKFGFCPADRDIREMAQPALDRVAAAGMAIELNTSGLRWPVREIYPSPLALSLAFERGIPITFGSDAHSPADVGCGFDQAVRLARQIGYTTCGRFRARQQTPAPLPLPAYVTAGAGVRGRARPAP
ncbi:MAG: histidinol-phosphatase HisJ family protein [Verrucomicrobiota bacterium]|nr:histidinol-phosphatase HisJ family protein [Verrucomicrobiota bacterium]